MNDNRTDPKAELINRFAYHPATPERGRQHERVRECMTQVALEFFDTLPNGRHKAMALTSLQEAMWAANAAIACDSPAE